jgi:hypothetical protein
LENLENLPSIASSPIGEEGQKKGLSRIRSGGVALGLAIEWSIFRACSFRLVTVAHCRWLIQPQQVSSTADSAQIAMPSQSRSRVASMLASKSFSLVSMRHGVNGRPVIPTFAAVGN